MRISDWSSDVCSSDLQLPSALCEALNTDPASPFYQLIRRESDVKAKAGIVTDNALIETMKASLKSPSGALGQYRRHADGNDTEAMFEQLLIFCSAVRDTFPDAWGRSPTESRDRKNGGKGK